MSVKYLQWFNLWIHNFPLKISAISERKQNDSFILDDSYLEITDFVNHGGKNFNCENNFQKAHEREIFG